MNTPSQSSPGQFQRVVGQLRELLAKATPGLWVGDRLDGTVKYCILGGQDRAPVCRGDNGNSEHGPYGFDSSFDEELVMAMRNALPALLAIAEAAGDVIESRYHPQYDMTEKLDALECATIDLRTALPLLPIPTGLPPGVCPTPQSENQSPPGLPAPSC